MVSYFHFNLTNVQCRKYRNQLIDWHQPLFRICMCRFRQQTPIANSVPESNTSNKILTASMHQNKLFRGVTFAWLKNTKLMTCSLILGFPVLRKVLVNNMYYTPCIDVSYTKWIFLLLVVLIYFPIIATDILTNHFSIFFSCCTLLGNLSNWH